MKTNFYPVLMCKDLQAEADFFITLFDFNMVFSSDWYISLKDNDGFELAMIDHLHATIPLQYQSLCKGIILNIKVDIIEWSQWKKTDNENAVLLLEEQLLVARQSGILIDFDIHMIAHMVSGALNDLSISIA